MACGSACRLRIGPRPLLYVDHHLACRVPATLVPFPVSVAAAASQETRDVTVLGPDVHTAQFPGGVGSG